VADVPAFGVIWPYAIARLAGTIEVARRDEGARRCASRVAAWAARISSSPLVGASLVQMSGIVVIGSIVIAAAALLPRLTAPALPPRFPGWC
jgi:hypothetical protein